MMAILILLTFIGGGLCGFLVSALMAACKEDIHDRDNNQ